MTDLHLSSQTTQKYGIPLNHLEYSYVEKCSDAKELEKILRVLRSGEEGRFPDLETFVEKRLESLNPKSRLLRKENPIAKLGEFGSGDWQAIQQDLKEWSNDMHHKDSAKSGKVVKASQEDLYEGDENLPPVRSTNVVLEGNKLKETNPSKSNKKKVLPRDYKEWDKVDIDAELEKIDETDEKKKTISHQTSVKGITHKLDGAGLSEEEKERKANREKDKGNEAYRSGDYEESVTYYSRSISLLPTSASYNNRALAYLKMEKWDKAIKDCNIVLNLEKENVKALLRRGTAYKSKNQLPKGKADFEKVLELEPNNKKAETLLMDVNKLLNEETKSRKEKGRRMVIEEVESEEDEEIEVEKPMTNGYGKHNGVKENGIHKTSQGNVKQNVEIKKGDQPSEKKKKEPEHLTSKQQSSSSHASKSNKDTKEMCSKQQQKNVSGTSTTPHVPAESDKKDKKEKGISDKTTAATERSNKDDIATNALSGDKASSQSSSSSSASPEIPVDPTPVTPLKSNPVSATPSSSSSSSSSVSSSTMAAEKSSSAPSTPGGAMQAEANSPSYSRPVLVQLPLPTQVSKLKGEGNNLFRSGQYDSALQFYSKALTLLEKEKDQTVNISLLLSNRAACQLKTGNCSEAVRDCCRSLDLVPHSLKSLLRRAAAYEALEVFGKAYVDYKHVLSIDTAVDQASQGASRCQRMLQDIHGQKSWREKIPTLNFVQPWEIPLIVDKAPSSQASPTGSVTAQPEKGGHDKQSVKSPPAPCNDKKEMPQLKEVPQSNENKETPRTKEVPQSNENKETPRTKEVPPRDEKKETPQPSKQEQFERLKASGNSHVQKGQYSEAEKCYTSCITLCPEQVACYTNRALCYIKLNKAADAETDCDKALTLQADNPKALYRRALARKMLQRYKLSMQDLIELLKLEPKNKAASSEMETVKKFYKEELENLKLKKQEADKKVRKRMKIEEVDNDDDEEKTGRNKSQGKSQSKLRGAKSNQPPSTIKSKGNSQTATEKKQSTSKETSASSSTSSLSSSSSSSSSSHSVPVAPPSTPRMLKTTPYEFCQAWNSLKPTQGIQPYAEILRQISPPDLPSVISNKLDGQMLQIIVRCVHEEMVLKGEVDKGYQILDNLCKVPRFSTVSMFLSSKEKKEVSSVLDILGETSSSTYSKTDVSRLKKEYSVR